jgi:hypothetical protein
MIELQLPEAGTSSLRFALLTNHGHVLSLIAQQPDIRMREIAANVGITERAVQRIVDELTTCGYIGVTNTSCITPWSNIAASVTWSVSCLRSFSKTRSCGLSFQTAKAFSVRAQSGRERLLWLSLDERWRQESLLSLLRKMLQS